MPTKIRFKLNGKQVSVSVASHILLVDFIRKGLDLTGTHVGCDTSQCGSCTVLIDGLPVKACSMLAVQADGHDIITIEGLATEEELHPMQQAFRDHHALQCGFCTSGMIMTAIGIAEYYGPAVSDTVIRRELQGNFCRCTGYHNIVKAISAGAKAMGGK